MNAATTDPAHTLATESLSLETQIGNLVAVEALTKAGATNNDPFPI